MKFETEKGFMQAVIDMARLNGWLVLPHAQLAAFGAGIPGLDAWCGMAA